MIHSFDVAKTMQVSKNFSTKQYLTHQEIGSYHQ